MTFLLKLLLQYKAGIENTVEERVGQIHEGEKASARVKFCESSVRHHYVQASYKRLFKIHKVFDPNEAKASSDV